MRIVETEGLKNMSKTQTHGRTVAPSPPVSIYLCSISDILDKLIYRQDIRKQTIDPDRCKEYHNGAKEHNKGQSHILPDCKCN